MRFPRVTYSEFHAFGQGIYDHGQNFRRFDNPYAEREKIQRSAARFQNRKRKAWFLGWQQAEDVLRAVTRKNPPLNQRAAEFDGVTKWE